MRVSNNRQQCCHVAGDIDFDKHNNLWLVPGDDNEASGIGGGGWGPMNDPLTDELQTLRVNNATGAQIDAAIEALSTVGANNIQTLTAGDATLSVADPSPRAATGHSDDPADVRRTDVQRRGRGLVRAARSVRTTRCEPAATRKTLTFTLSTTTP